MMKNQKRNRLKKKNPKSEWMKIKKGNPHNLKHLHEKVDQHSESLIEIKNDIEWLRYMIRNNRTFLLGILASVIVSGVLLYYR